MNIRDAVSAVIFGVITIIFLLPCFCAPASVSADLLPAVDPLPLQAELGSPRLKGILSLRRETNLFHCQIGEGESSTSSDKKAKSVLHSAGGKTKSLVNFVFDLRGFDWSKEGANAIEDKNIDTKNDSAKEYLVHKQRNAQEIAKTDLVMQLAMFMDQDEKKAGDAFAELEKLVGSDEAIDIFSDLKAMSGEDLQLDRERLVWDIAQKRDNVQAILETTASTDPVLIDVTERLSKYNHRSKFMQVTAKVVYSSLGLASFTPTLVAPIAESALLTFMMSTGGPEQDKLLRELYLGKILQSRCEMLTEKAHIATESLDLALLTNNRRLLCCTKALLSDLTDRNTAERLIGPFSTTSSTEKQVLSTSTSMKGL